MSVRTYAGKRGTHWYAIIELSRDNAGKRLQDIIRKDPLTGLPIPTKKRAQEIEREELVKRHRGTTIEPSTSTFAEFLTYWMTETRGTRAESTDYNWWCIIRGRLTSELGTIPLGTL